VTSLSVLAVSMVNVSCLECALVTLDGVDPIAPSARKGPTANSDAASTNHSSVHVSATTKVLIVKSQYARRDVTQKMAFAKCRSSVGANPAGLVRIVTSAFPIIPVSMEAAKNHTSAIARKDGSVQTATAPKRTKTATGASGANGALAAAAANPPGFEPGPGNATPPPLSATEPIALTTEATARRTSPAMTKWIVVTQLLPHHPQQI